MRCFTSKVLKMSGYQLRSQWNKVISFVTVGALIV